MRGFVLLCLIAATTGNNVGYNYQTPGQSVAPNTSGYNNAGISGGSHGASIGIGSHGRIGNGIGNGASGGYGGLAVSDTSTTNFVGGAGNSRINQQQPTAPVSAAPSEFNKEFFTFSAPEEEFNDGGSAAQQQRIAGSVKKNLRVVFIKTPENKALTNAALQLAQQASEERTAIYVLSKQTDIGELAEKLQTIKSAGSHKPEVHFIKYRTPEDAVRAQQAIQAQYDALGGTSHTSNEGVAPVLNFASQPATNFNKAASGGDSSTGYGTAPAPIPQKNAYLPPKF